MTNHKKTNNGCKPRRVQRKQPASHENPSSSVMSVSFSRENHFPPKRQKRPKIAKHTKARTLTKTIRDFP